MMYEEFMQIGKFKEEEIDYTTYTVEIEPMYMECDMDKTEFVKYFKKNAKSPMMIMARKALREQYRTMHNDYEVANKKRIEAERRKDVIEHDWRNRYTQLQNELRETERQLSNAEHRNYALDAHLESVQNSYDQLLKYKNELALNNHELHKKLDSISSVLAG